MRKPLEGRARRIGMTLVGLAAAAVVTVPGIATADDALPVNDPAGQPATPTVPAWQEAMPSVPAWQEATPSVPAWQEALPAVPVDQQATDAIPAAPLLPAQGLAPSVAAGIVDGAH